MGGDNTVGARARRSHASSNPQWQESCLYALAILFGVYLRVDRFWEPSLWLDELATAYVALAGDWATLWKRAVFDWKPPVYPALVKVLLVFGRQEFVLRLPSVIFGVATIGVVMLTLRRVSGGRAALYAGALLALNSQAIFNSQEARMYAMALFAAAASTHFFVTLVEGGGKQALIAYAITTLLASYSHLLYTSVLLGQVAVVVYLLLSLREQSGALRRMLATQMVLVVLLTPLASLFDVARASAGRASDWIAVPGLHQFLRLLSWPEFSLAAIGALVGLTRLWKRRARLLGWTAGEKALLDLGLVYFSILPAAIALARFGTVNIALPRYLLLSLLGGVIVASLVIVRADDAVLRLVLWTFVLLVAILHAAIPIRIGPWISIPKEDWRGAIRWVEERYGPEDVVLLRSGIYGAQYLPLSDPLTLELLSVPLCGFYNRGVMNVINLPWSAEELEVSPLTPLTVRDKVRRSRQILVIINSQMHDWDWERLERWILDPNQPTREVEKRTFQLLEVRMYRLPSPSGPRGGSTGTADQGLRRSVPDTR